MVPILSMEIFTILKWLRVRMPNVGVDLGYLQIAVQIKVGIRFYEWG